MANKRRITSLAKKMAFADCQAIAHQWHKVDGMPIRGGKRIVYLEGIRKTFRCGGCSAYREDIYSRATGDLMARVYRYPAGYKLDIGELPEGMTRKGFLRLAWLQQEVESLPKPKRRGRSTQGLG